MPLTQAQGALLQADKVKNKTGLFLKIYRYTFKWLLQIWWLLFQLAVTHHSMDISVFGQCLRAENSTAFIYLMDFGNRIYAAYILTLPTCLFVFDGRVLGSQGELTARFHGRNNGLSIFK